VVNDLGGTITGDGADAEPAESVVAQIVAAGGAAVADGHDVATVEGADALIGAAIGHYGRVDILINNAGIIRWAGLPEADADNLAQHLAVHVTGSFNTARAAWPHLAGQGYGRIVMTTSSGFFGLPTNLSYAAAKGAVMGLTRSLAVAGAKKGIKVNALAPAAMTRMAGPASGEPDPTAPLQRHMAAELVAPMAAFLAHESCPVTGEIYAAGAGRFARIFIASTPGYVDAGATVEDIAENWAAINDEGGYTVPASLMEWSAAFLGHLPRD
jgi:NAD(P)-dependent dehydrogenase (short-subunit alcohol dehydrogenase family)